MTYRPLKGFDNIHDYSITNNIQDSLVEYFDWGLLEKGNYFNVTKGELSTNGQDMSLMRLSASGSFTPGRVWEGFRSNWVWQSGVSGPGMSAPLVGSDAMNPGISGVYVDDVFYPRDTVGTYAHKVDHFGGRIVFNNPIPVESKVRAEFSYKHVNVVYANNVPWLREIQQKSQSPASQFYNSEASAWSPSTDSRLQLPAIAIEIVPVRRFKPYQIGGGRWVYTDVVFHCIAEDDQTRNMLIDIVSMQEGRYVYTIDGDRLDSEKKFPIDNQGFPVPSALLYPEIISSYGAGRFRMTEAKVESMQMMQGDLFGGVVRFTTEAIKTNI
jgi:hypothetical protein